MIPEEVAQFYVNNLSVLVTPWDFVLLYGALALPANVSTQGEPIQQSSGVRVEAAIRMSPQHAKAGLKLMQRMVETYENQFGEIRLPPEESAKDENQKIDSSQ